MHDIELVIVDPDTGEVIDIGTLADRELDELHLYLSIMEREYRRLQQMVWNHLRKRAIEQGGLEGARRRWRVERRPYSAVTVEHKRGAQ